MYECFYSGVETKTCCSSDFLMSSNDVVWNGARDFTVMFAQSCLGADFFNGSVVVQRGHLCGFYNDIMCCKSENTTGDNHQKTVLKNISPFPSITTSRRLLRTAAGSCGRLRMQTQRPANTASATHSGTNSGVEKKTKPRCRGGR